jgi:hypothetical protein
MELTSLKKKHKGALELYGSLPTSSLPKSELDAETLELLNKTDAAISSDDLANAGLDITGAKQLVFQLETLTL